MALTVPPGPAYLSARFRPAGSQVHFGAILTGATFSRRWLLSVEDDDPTRLFLAVGLYFLAIISARPGHVKSGASCAISTLCRGGALRHRLRQIRPRLRARGAVARRLLFLRRNHGQSYRGQTLTPTKEAQPLGGCRLNRDRLRRKVQNAC